MRESQGGRPSSKGSHTHSNGYTVAAYVLLIFTNGRNRNMPASPDSLMAIVAAFSALLALVAVMIGPYFAGRAQHKNNVAAMRERWMKDLREVVSEFTEIATHASGQARMGGGEMALFRESYVSLVKLAAQARMLQGAQHVCVGRSGSGSVPPTPTPTSLQVLASQNFDDGFPETQLPGFLPFSTNFQGWLGNQIHNTSFFAFNSTPNALWLLNDGSNPDSYIRTPPLSNGIARLSFAAMLGWSGYPPQMRVFNHA